VLNSHTQGPPIQLRAIQHNKRGNIDLVELSFSSSAIQTGHALAVESIFITGGSGFVGRALLSRLSPDRYHRVYCLSRSTGPSAGQSNISFLAGTLQDIERYERELAESDAVIHLAAATGKATRSQCFAVNVEGTGALLEACRRTGVSRFLYVSSIAVNFPDKRRYYYAQSKQQAEELVRQSGLCYSIVRPAMVLGTGSPVLAGLAKLAKQPLVPVFGNGRTRVQPIDVGNLAEFLLMTLEDDMLAGKTVEFGGPEVITIEELVKKIGALHRENTPRTVHLPMSIVRSATAAAETVAYSAAPLTVGQLATFRFDGTTATNPLFERQLPRLKTIDQMLAGSIKQESAGEDSQLRRECRVFSFYLSGHEPTEYIAVKYVDAHQKVAALAPGGKFERLLLKVATVHPIFTRIADSYARLLAPTSALRKKLVLLLALLESSAASERFLDRVDSGNVAVLSFKLLGHGVRFLISLAAAVVILFPCRLLLGGKTTRTEGR
jgi:nucleoside-diphosphate-sugar epimerase